MPRTITQAKGRNKSSRKELSPEEQQAKDLLARHTVLYKKWKKGCATKGDIRELTECGFLGNGNGKGMVPDVDLCESLASLATRLHLHYLNADKTSKLKSEINQQTINDWRHGKRLGIDNTPPPASVHGYVGNRWSLRDWIAWFDAHLWNEWKREAPGESTHPAAIDLETFRRQREFERLEHEKWEEEKERGKFISVVEAQKVANGIVNQLCNWFRTEAETKRIPRWQELCREILITPEQTAKILEFERQLGISMVDTIDYKCAESAKVGEKTMQEQIKKL
jgi:hypothetical protein